MDEIQSRNMRQVKYDNAFNRANLGGLSVMASNILMLIARDIRDRGTQSISFSDEYLMQDFVMGSGNRTHGELIKALIDISMSLIKIAAPIKEGRKIKVKSVFEEFEIDNTEDYSDKRLIVKVHPEYTFLFNELAKNFTTFELREFASLRFTRAKTLYRLLKQYRTQGWLYIPVEDSREGYPDVFKLFFRFDSTSDEKVMSTYETIRYYRKNKRYIAPQVLQRATNECGKFFKNLDLHTVKDPHKRGQPITGYKWTFDKEISAMYPKKPEKAGKSGSTKSKLQKYDNFQQRDYDYAEMERLLANSPNN